MENQKKHRNNNIQYFGTFAGEKWKIQKDMKCGKYQTSRTVVFFGGGVWGFCISTFHLQKSLYHFLFFLVFSTFHLQEPENVGLFGVLCFFPHFTFKSPKTLLSVFAKAQFSTN